MEFQGRISKMPEPKTGTRSDGSTWVRQDYIFEYHESEDQRYPDHLLFSAMNERINEYALHEGDEVKLGFAPGVRENNGNYYCEIRVFKLVKVKAAPVQEQPTRAAAMAAGKAKEAVLQEQPKADTDDLPF